MKKFILVRHGETDWNKIGRFQGQTDIPLNEFGLAQADATGIRLAATPFAAIYASDLTRTRQTAASITAHHDLPLQTDSRLREIDFGKWEGLSWAQIGEQYPGSLDAWAGDYWNHTPPSGESVGEATARIAAGFDAIYAKHDNNDTVCLVAHGGTLQLLLCHLLGLRPNFRWQFRTDNCAVSEVGFHNEDAFIALWNGRSHLANLVVRPTSIAG